MAAWLLLLVLALSGAPARADVTLLDDGPWRIDGLEDAGAAQIQLTVDRLPAGSFAAVRFTFEGDDVLVLRGDGSVAPQLPGGPLGATATLGSYWECDGGLVGPLRFVSLDLPGRAKKSGKLHFRGELSNGDSLTSEKLRIRIHPPRPDRLRVEFRYGLRTLRHVCVDRDRKDLEDVFRIVELAAGYRSPAEHTNDLVRYVKNVKLDCDLFECDLDRIHACRELANETGPLFSDPDRMHDRELGLFHTTDAPAPTPTLELELRKPHPHDVKPQGFTTASDDPAERNVSVWADWRDVERTTGADRRLGDFRFRLTLEPPRAPGCDRFED